MSFSACFEIPRALKIPWGSPPVWVRFPPPAPFFLSPLPCARPSPSPRTPARSRFRTAVRRKSRLGGDVAIPRSKLQVSAHPPQYLVVFQKLLVLRGFSGGKYN